MCGSAIYLPCSVLQGALVRLPLSPLLVRRSHAAHGLPKLLAESKAGAGREQEVLASLQLLRAANVRLGQQSQVTRSRSRGNLFEAHGGTGNRISTYGSQILKPLTVTTQLL